MKLKNRMSRLRISKFIAVSLLLGWLATSARAQTVVATIPVGTDFPRAMAANPVTNKIYVASCSFHGIGQLPTGSLTVIDGATNATAVTKGCFVDLAVNSVTNKIYFPGGVIDGATNSLTNLSAAGGIVVAVNPVTNKIYVANGAGFTYVIDGATNSITTVIDPNASSLSPAAIAVNSVTNKIYVANNSIPIPFSTNPGNVTVIDGATNSTTTITDPNAFSPLAVAVNSATNKIYVANDGDFYLNPPGSNDGNVTVIDGATNSTTTLTDPNVFAPQAVAVDETTNKIYVVIPNGLSLNGDGALIIIDGATNTISKVKDPNATYPRSLALDSVTDTIYVANSGCQNDACSHPGSVTVINGATNGETTVINPQAPYPDLVEINPTTNKIYVLNSLANGGDNVTVIDGGATPTSHLLSLLFAGNGSGTVTSTPAGVSCGTSCTASFATGTAVNLTASAASGFTFSGWAATCTGTAACSIPMTSDVFVTAVFDGSPPPDFLVLPASTNLSVQRGGHVTDLITIAPLVSPQVSPFGEAFQFSCTVSGPAPMPACSLSPSSMTTGATEASSTLTITAPGMAAALTPPTQGWRRGLLYTAVLPLTGLLLIGFGMTAGDSKPRKRQLLLLCSLFIMFVAFQAGCGGGSSSQPVQPQNYIVTVTATAGTLQHTTQVNVTVQ